MRTIEVRDVGPVEHVSIPIPEGGGLVVLRARNGGGKTRTLEAVESLVSGRGKVEVRDGALKGSVDGFGATINVARSTRRTGELEVTTLEGRLSVAELVDPGLVSPEAADAARIKALVGLSGVAPDAALFYPLLGSQAEFEKYANTKPLGATDLVSLAGVVKRQLETSARSEEGHAQTAEAHAKAKRDAIEGIDVKAVCDATALQEVYLAAVVKQSEMKTQAEHAHQVAAQAKEAQKALDAADANYEGYATPEASERERAASHALSEAELAEDVARDALVIADRAYTSANLALTQAVSDLRIAEAHERDLDAWQATIDSVAECVDPDYDELHAAGEAVEKARAALEQGALVRKAKLDAADAEAQQKIADEHAKLAERLRHAAKGTDDVLSEVVAKSGTALRVEAGRLVLTTKRGDTYFGELSHGERWKMALDLAIEAVGEDGLLVIPQACWEGLDGVARRMIAGHVKDRGVVILTAECSEEEQLKAEVFSDDV